MFHIVITCAHNVSRSNEYAFNVPQGSYQLITHQQHYTVITVTHHTKSLLRAAQSGSEDGTVLFFHIPPSSVTHFLLPLHNQFNFLSRCAMLQAWVVWYVYGHSLCL